MNILLPNWNLKFESRFYNSVSSLKSYANNHNLILTEVTNLSEINKLLRKHNIGYIDVNRVFVGW